MKIITKGMVERKTCSKCGCVMEYDPNDIHEKRNYIITGFFSKAEYWNIKYIICPCCCNEIEINAHCEKQLVGDKNGKK